MVPKSMSALPLNTEFKMISDSPRTVHNTIFFNKKKY